MVEGAGIRQLYKTDEALIVSNLPGFVVILILSLIVAIRASVGG